MEQSAASVSTPGPTPTEDEDAESLALALRLQEEDRAYMSQVMEHSAAAAATPEQNTEDAESLALAMRLQQEDDDAALRGVLGIADGEDPESPSNYSYEQLLRLNETVGEVSKGASSDVIEALPCVCVAAAKADSTIMLGEQVDDSAAARAHSPVDMLWT